MDVGGGGGGGEGGGRGGGGGGGGRLYFNMCTLNLKMSLLQVKATM